MDDWEAEFDEECAKSNAAAAAARVLPAGPAKKVDTVTAPSKVGQALARAGPVGGGGDASLPDSLTERDRILKQIEEEEKSIIGDLLQGCDLTTEDTSYSKAVLSVAVQPKRTAAVVSSVVSAKGPVDLSNANLNNNADCQRIANQLGVAIARSKAKSPAWLAFMTTLFSHVENKMDNKDIKTLSQKIESANKKSIIDRKIQLQSKKKVNDDVKREISHYKEEYDMMFGDEDLSEVSDEVDEEIGKVVEKEIVNQDDDGFM